ncbi:hypothetical protein [Flagellimonas sp. 2504JD4-2]
MKKNIELPELKNPAITNVEQNSRTLNAVVIAAVAVAAVKAIL